MDAELALLDRWRGGDTAAGNQLFELHYDGIYRFFAHKVPDEVADLVQRTFLGCVEAKQRFAGESTFRTFLFAVARNQLYNHFRRKRAQPDLAVGTTSLRDLAPSPSTLLAHRREQRLLLEALRSLDLDTQVLLELHYWEDMTGPELSRVLDLPEGTVRSRLRRAKEVLRERLEALAEKGALASTVSNLQNWSESLAAMMQELSET